MIQKLKKKSKRVLAFMLSLVTILTAFSTSATTVFTADGTLHFNSGESLPYGDYFTTRMTFDGANTAYCLEPLKKTPEAGNYQYNFLPQDSPIRKALYYLNGGYGYETVTKDQCFHGWSDTDSYVIGHLALAYIFDNYNEGGGAFHGAPANFITKAKEVVNVINSLPDPPKSFRAFILQADNHQTIAGSWYEKPYGWIELYKSTANGQVSDGNGNYSLKGAKYGTGLANRELVVFEKLYIVGEDTEIEVINHEDIKDEGQTVKVVEKPKPEIPDKNTPKTGDDSHVDWWILLSALAMGGIAVFSVLALKKNTNTLLESYDDSMIGDDYVEMVEMFADRVKEQCAKVREEQAKVTVPREKITEDMCNPMFRCGDMTGKVMAIRAEVLRPEYRSAEHQLVYVVGGNGARQQSFGTACYCITLYSGEHERWERQDFHGEVKQECLPQWAKEKKMEIEQREAGRQAQKMDREVR